MYAKDLRYQARQNLAGRWAMAILVAFLAMLLGGMLTGAGVNFKLELEERTMQRLPEPVLKALTVWAGVAGTLGFVQFILGGVIKLGYCRFLLKNHDGEEGEVSDLFSRFEHFGDGFVLQLLTGLYIALWTMLFIIPGIVASYKYAMAPFIMEENPGMKASEAITASKEMMDGHKADLFVLDLSFLGWALLALLTCGVGNLWLNPYKNAAYAAFYRTLQPKAVVVEE